MSLIWHTQGAKLVANDAAKQLIKLNTQLAKLTRSNHYYESLSLFQQIHSSNLIRPDHYSLSTALTASAKSPNSAFGNQLHAHAIYTGLTAFNHVSNALLSFYAKSKDLGSVKMAFSEMGLPDIYSWTTLLSACTKLGQLSHACQLLDEMPLRKVEPWNAVITGCADDGRHGDAFDLFRKMHILGLKHDNYTLACVLSLCSVGMDVIGGQVHSLVFKTGYSGWSSVMNSMLSMYFNCGIVSDASKVFEETDEVVRNEITYNAMINGLVSVERNEEAVVLFKEMLEAQLRPTELTSVSLMSSELDLVMCCQLHAHAVKAGYESITAVSNAAMAMYADHGQLDAARKIFEKLGDKDVVSWNTVIAGYGQNQCATLAFAAYVEMQRSGIKPDEYTMGTLITSAESLELVQMCYTFALKNGLVLIIEVVNALVSAFINQGDVTAAYHMFCSMPSKNQITWNAMISGILLNGDPSRALELFLRMQNSLTEPDVYSLTTVLSICSSSSALEQGKQVHAYILRHLLLTETSLGNGLITMYSKCGCLHRSCRVFNCMIIRDVVSWNAVISALAQYGEGRKAVECFKKMQSEIGIRPDQATFTAVLSACSHAGLVYDGIYIFNSMIGDYGFEPGTNQFSCLIDLLARAGHLDETERLIKNKDFGFDSNVLWTLFSACAAYGNVRLGKIVAGLLLQTAKSDPAIYVLLSNIHANAGQWEDAANVREMMKTVGVMKQPGCSWFKP